MKKTSLKKMPLAAIKFQHLLDELKGQSLSNAIDYWCMANNIDANAGDFEGTVNKLNELLRSNYETI